MRDAVFHPFVPAKPKPTPMCVTTKPAACCSEALPVGGRPSKAVPPPRRLLGDCVVTPRSVPFPFFSCGAFALPRQVLGISNVVVLQKPERCGAKVAHSRMANEAGVLMPSFWHLLCLFWPAREPSQHRLHAHKMQ
jgi:hypothetical protein